MLLQQSSSARNQANVSVAHDSTLLVQLSTLFGAAVKRKFPWELSSENFRGANYAQSPAELSNVNFRGAIKRKFPWYKLYTISRRAIKRKFPWSYQT